MSWGAKASSAGIAVVNNDVDGKAAAEGIAKGLGIGAYESSRFKHGPAATRVAGAKLFFPPSASSAAELLAGAAQGNAVASGILLARYLVEAPPNVCTPRHLARAAESIAAAAPDVFGAKILGQRACEEMGMGAFLGVSACSALEPQFIHLTYTPPGFKEDEEGPNRDVALVGKGLTFDSGGYNLKVSGEKLFFSPADFFSWFRKSSLNLAFFSLFLSLSSRNTTSRSAA